MLLYVNHVWHAIAPDVDASPVAANQRALLAGRGGSEVEQAVPAAPKSMKAGRGVDVSPVVASLCRGVFCSGRSMTVESDVGMQCGGLTSVAAAVSAASFCWFAATDATKSTSKSGIFSREKTGRSSRDSIYCLANCRALSSNNGSSHHLRL